MARVLASTPGDPVWVVGGAVRGALLGDDEPAADLDLVVEGDGRAVGRALADALGVIPVVHDRFQTAALVIPGREIDVVTARREVYPEPGALPEITPSSLADDLGRRDFTISALAVCLRGPDVGRLADAHAGREDLDARLIRRIRPGEFVEDPSRTVRGARYAAGLDFTIEAETAQEMTAGATEVDLASARVAEEAARMAAEDSAAAGFRHLADLGVAWARDDVAARDLAALDAASAHPGAPRVDRTSLRLGRAVRPDALATAELPGWSRAQAQAVGAGAALAARLAGAPMSAVDRLAASAPAAAQVAAAAEGSPEIIAWWERGRDLELAIDGEDLLAAGCVPGPALGRGLAAARAAALDGLAPDRDGQLRVALDAARLR